MGVKFDIDPAVQKALGITVINGKIVASKTGNMIEAIRKDFAKTAPKQIRQTLLRDVTKGISPVKGQGKFKKYSKSYKNVIWGRGMFRKFGGKTVYIEGVPDETILSAASPKKKASPVTLRLTGQLHNALKVFTSGDYRSKFRLNFDWRDFLADIHNRRGAGKSKTVRRMLPTNSGEEFNKEITDDILTRLKKSVARIVDRLN